MANGGFSKKRGVGQPVQPCPERLEEFRQDSKEDWIEVWLTNGPEDPMGDAPYILFLADGKTIEGKFDADGHTREDGLAPGRVRIELPGLFEICEMEDKQQIRGPTRGVPWRPSRLPPPGDTEDRWITVRSQTEDDEDPDDLSLDDDELDDDDDELDDDDDELDDDDLEEFPDESSDPGDSGDLLDRPPGYGATSSSGSSQGDDHEYEVSSVYRRTGEEVHLAVIHCICVRLLQPNGNWYREPLEFELKHEDGRTLATGESEEGVIFYDGVGIGRFELVISGESHFLSSSPHADTYDEIYIDPQPSAGDTGE